MKKLIFFALLIAAIIFAAFHAPAHAAAVADHLAIMLAVGSDALRAQYDSLKAQAVAMRNTIRDDMSAEQVRAIENRHDAITAEIDSVCAALRREEKPWARGFYASAGTSGIALAQLNEIVEAAADHQQARDALIDAMASANNANKPRPGGAPTMSGPGYSSRNATFSNPSFLETSIGDALYARMSGKAPEGPARELAGRPLLDLGVMMLEARGERVSWLNRGQLAERVMMASLSGPHSTSDFPNLLTGAGQRVLLDAYSAAESPLKKIARRRDSIDFRPITALRLSEAPRLDLVGESAEITSGSRAESKESFKVATYAKNSG